MPSSSKIISTFFLHDSILYKFVSNKDKRKLKKKKKKKNSEVSDAQESKIDTLFLTLLERKKETESHVELNKIS